MCEPTTIAVGAAALSGALQIKQSNEQAKATERSLRQSADNASIGAQVQTNELVESATDQISERVRQSLIERRRLQVAAGQGGISGATVDRIVNTSQGNLGRDVTTIQRNLASQDQQIQLQQRGIQSDFANRATQIQRIHPAIGALKIASTIYSNQPRTNPKTD